MKTEDLVSLLATGVEPIDVRRTARRYVLALIGGMLGALAITVGILHLNRALSQEVFENLRSWAGLRICA